MAIKKKTAAKAAPKKIVKKATAKKAAPAKKVSVKKDTKKATKATKTTKAKATKVAKTTKVTKAAKVTKAVQKAVVLNAASLKPIDAKQTKAQIYAELAEMSGVSKSDVKNVFLALRGLVHRHIKVRGSGEITIPGVSIKVRRVTKKATKKRMGRNPFTGETVAIAAKPARKSVKATALKSLKNIAEEL